jgi:hypothetical protein
MTTLNEKDISQQIQSQRRPDGVINLINYLYLSDTSNSYLLDMKLESINLNYNQMVLFQRKKVDIISIHRQCIERLNLLATQGQSENIVKECFTYIINVILDLIYEVDIVITGMKLISDLVPYLLVHRDKVFKVVLDCIQYYAANSPYHRPREAPRHLQSLEEKQKAREKEAEKKAKEEGAATAGSSGGGDRGSGSADNLYGQLKASTQYWGNSLGAKQDPDRDNPFKDNVELAAEWRFEQQRIRTNFIRFVKDIPDEEISAKMNQFTRYASNALVVEDERSNYRKDTKSLGIFEYVKVIEVDENMEVISPRTRMLRKHEQMKAEAEQKRRGYVPSNQFLKDEQDRRSKEEKDKSDLLAMQQRYQEKLMSIVYPGVVNPSPLPQSSAPPVGEGEIKVFLADRPRTLRVQQDQQEQPTPAASSSENKEEVKPSTTSTLSKVNEHEEENLSLTSSKHSLPSLIKPSDLLKQEEMKSRPKFVIKARSFKDDDEDADAQGLATPVKWKGTKGEIGRRAAPPDSIDPNRILSKNRSQKSIWSSNKSKSKSNLNSAASTPVPLSGSPSVSNLPTNTAPSAASTPVPMASTGKGKSIRFKDDAVATNSNTNTSSAVGTPLPPIPGAVAAPVATPATSDPVTPAPSTPGTTDKEAPPAEEGDANAADWLPDVTSTVKRKQKPKFFLEPLPETEFPKFRIFDFQMKENVVLIQGFATILKLVTNSFSNRDYAFRTHLTHELAEIVLVSQAIPKILEYFIDIFHVLYAEGIGDPLDITWQEPEDPSMILSASHAATTENNSLAEKEDASSKLVIDAISEMSLPSIDADAQLSLVSISDNKFNPKYKKKKNKGAPGADEDEEVGAGGGGGGREGGEENADDPAAIYQIHQVDNESKRSVNAVAVKPPKRDKQKDEPFASTKEIAAFTNRQRIKYNESILSRIGLSEYDLRYRTMPVDPVVIALSMCSFHIEVTETLRTEAAFWLEHFNDNSRDFYVLKRKGMSLAAM